MVKVHTTTPLHDKPFSMTPMEVMIMLGMYQHWQDNPDTKVTIAGPPDGSNVFLFVNPRDKEWSAMNRYSHILVRMPNENLEPLSLA